MSGICAEVCCCGLPQVITNGLIGGMNACGSGTLYICSSAISGCLLGCGTVCSSIVGLLSSLLGGMLDGGGGGVANALPAVMQNAGGGK